MDRAIPGPVDLVLRRHQGLRDRGHHATSAPGQTLHVVCRRARRDVRFGPKTDPIPMPNPVAQLLALL
jgi:hypothetical protein